jgi:hypothetical protein
VEVELEDVVELLLEDDAEVVDPFDVLDAS